MSCPLELGLANRRHIFFYDRGSLMTPRCAVTEDGPVTRGQAVMAEGLRGWKDTGTQEMERNTYNIVKESKLLCNAHVFKLFSSWAGH